MVSVKSKLPQLIICLFISVWLLFAQVIANSIVLIPCLLSFIILAVYSAYKQQAVLVLMFFFPFSPLLKLQPGTVSFFTIALVAVYLVYIVFSNRNITIVHFVPALLITILNLIVKVYKGYSIDNSFILFTVSLFVVPFLCKEINNKYDFYWLTVFFSVGIIFAAVSAEMLIGFPTITRYIETHSLLDIIRLSGYYGDPNFYSAHITAALSGVLVLLLNNKSKTRTVCLLVLTLLLLYCGFLSVSKSFLLVTITIAFFYFITLMFKSGKLSVKIVTMLTIVGAVVFLLSSTLFTDLVSMMVSRLGMGGDNLSDFTTGRIDLWQQYLTAFSEDPLLFLFGNGYTKVFINDRSSHNTIIQLVFQFGLVGGLMLLIWCVMYIKALLKGVTLRFGNITQIFILLIGSFGAWMALDYLFFDEFFLIPFYVCVAIGMISANQTETDLTDSYPWK